MKLSKFFTPKKISLIILLVILAVTVITYSHSLLAELVDWDDQFQVSNNLDIQSLSLFSVRKIFSNFYAGMYQPLATLSFALENKIWHSFPLFLHLDNLLLHLLNIILVYLLTKKLFKKNYLALLSSALFALHPLQVETVAWVSARSNLLYTSFFLLALVAYVTYSEKAKLRYYFITLGCFILALLSKAPAVILPFILLLLDYYHQRQINKHLFLEKIPFFILSLGFGWLTIKGRGLDDLIPPIIYSWLDKLTFLAYSPLSYLQKILFPYNLSTFYALPKLSNGHLPIIFYLSVPIGLGLIFLMIKYRQKRTLLLGVAWWLLLILPSIQIKTFSTTLTADRYTYLANLGIFWLIALAIISAWKYFKNLRLILGLAIIIIFGLLAIQTNSQTWVWQNSTTLWIDVIKHNPTSASAYTNLGNAKSKNNDIVGAMEAYNQALKLNPQDPFIYNNIGTLLVEKTSRWQESLNYYNQAINLNPREALFYYNRGCALLKLNQKSEALKDYQIAVNLKSGEKFYNYTYLNSLANLEYRLEHWSQADKFYTQIIQTESQLADPYYFRGLARLKLGNKTAGCQDLAQADKLGYGEATKDYNKLCK